MKICCITAQLGCRKICSSSKFCKVIAQDLQQARNKCGKTQNNPPERAGEMSDGTRIILQNKQESLAKQEQVLVPKKIYAMSRANEIIPFSMGNVARSIKYQQ